MKTIVRNPSLLLLSLFPIVITLTLYIFVISALQADARAALVQHFAAWGWNPNGWGTLFVLLLVRIVLIIVGAVTFSFVASVTSSPFNDFLAERAERFGTPPLAPVKHASLGHKARLIAIDLAKTVAATAMTLLALVLSWVPVLNIIAFIAAFLLVAFQYISYPQTRRGQGFGYGMRFLSKHLFACVGFGAVFSLLFSVPILSSFCIPLAVVGGTLLVARAQEHPSLPPLK